MYWSWRLGNAKHHRDRAGHTHTNPNPHTDSNTNSYSGTYANSYSSRFAYIEFDSKSNFNNSRSVFDAYLDFDECYVMHGVRL